MGERLRGRKAIYWEEAGQGLVEYALIILLVALPALIGVTLFRDSVQQLYTLISNAFP